MIQMRYIVIPILLFFWGLWTRRAFLNFKKEGNLEASSAEVTWLIVHGISLLVCIIAGGNILVTFIVEHW